jgi:D-sedoheptulose 7-phosphate isomerase
MKLSNNLIKKIEESIVAKKSLLKQEKFISLAQDKIYKSILKNKKIFFCGNGGSASDAQHLTAELLIRLRPNINRKSIPAISLHMDASTLTACSNDYSFNYIFSRPLSALGQKHDILVVISTSGNSKNILEALKLAKKKKIFSIAFLGKKGGKAKILCDLPIIVESNITARIQEAHIFLGHYILEGVETKLLKNKNFFI